MMNAWRESAESRAEQTRGNEGIERESEGSAGTEGPWKISCVICVNVRERECVPCAFWKRDLWVYMSEWVSEVGSVWDFRKRRIRVERLTVCVMEKLSFKTQLVKIMKSHWGNDQISRSRICTQSSLETGILGENFVSYWWLNTIRNPFVLESSRV